MKRPPDTYYLLTLRAEPGEICPEQCIDCGEHHRVKQLDDKYIVGWQCGGRIHHVGVLRVVGERT